MIHAGCWLLSSSSFRQKRSVLWQIPPVQRETNWRLFADGRELNAFPAGRNGELENPGNSSATIERRTLTPEIPT